MPRKPRDTAAGFFHVYVHGVWAVPDLYRDDIDRWEFLRQLAYVTAATSWTCVAYCLMSNHYHLIVEVGDGTLPVAMHSLNRRYARRFNRRHGLRGHVLFDRYGAHRIADDLELLDRFTYVARNSVDAGVFSHPAEDPWNSYAGTVGLAELSSFVNPAAVFRCVDGLSGDPVAALRRHVERGTGPVPGTGPVDVVPLSALR